MTRRTFVVAQSEPLGIVIRSGAPSPSRYGSGPICGPRMMTTRGVALASAGPRRARRVGSPRSCGRAACRNAPELPLGGVCICQSEVSSPQSPTKYSPPFPSKLELSTSLTGSDADADPERQIHSLRAGRDDPRRGARRGIDIPTLCWYPKLPIVGNCRICLVSVQGQNKLVPACATPAADGMVVETESPAAVDNRRGVLDFLLERYPGEHLSPSYHGERRPDHGEVAGGNGSGASPERVRALRRPVRRAGARPPRAAAPRRRRAARRRDDPARHEPCILCTRCVRACEDIQEVGVLDVAHAGRARPDHRRAATAIPITPAAPGAANASGSAPPAPSSSSFPGSASAARRSASPDTGGPLGLSLLRASAARSTSTSRTTGHAGDLALDRGGHAQPGLDLREGPLRLRLSPAPRPPHQPAHPQGLGAPGRHAGSGPASRPGIAKGPGSPSRRWASGRSRGRRCGRSASRR